MLNMRQAAYISILIGLWLFSMAALMLGMDSLGIRPSFRTRFSLVDIGQLYGARRRARRMAVSEGLEIHSLVAPELPPRGGMTLAH